jgi:transcriptional regulator with XRE-family HTH domain
MGKRPRTTVRTLRVLRAERDLTQKAIADGAGLTQTRYWQIEHGNGAPVRKDEQAAIARMLAVSVRDIDWPIVAATELQKTRAEAREERRRVSAEAVGQA